jgi:deoxyuridine 5'-triphosphate nucleotidohydrolase
LNIKVLKLNESAKLPTKADGDMCYDVYANEDKFVQMGEISVIKTGIKMSPPEGYHYSVRDRSGLAAKNGLHIVAGQIDNSYRGELLVAMTKLSIGIYEIKKGDKIAQIKFEQDTTFPVVEVKFEEDLGYTNRGENGFGSSGR